MGGKVWSISEEQYFWRVAVSQSPKRLGFDVAKPEKSWVELAVEMQVRLGDNARRQYTGTMLFEHFFQNVEGKRHSPNAVPYVLEYLARRDRPRHLVNDADGPHPYCETAPGRQIRPVTERNNTGNPQQRSPQVAVGKSSSTVRRSATQTKNEASDLEEGEIREWVHIN
ncbi:hypothetical protein F5Y10DRAFT_270223 [Nemania abortiva]|nr:hypothetical protein F5Y10DRAFT_270223 [Nemania abortiva]